MSGQVRPGRFRHPERDRLGGTVLACAKVGLRALAYANVLALARKFASVNVPQIATAATPRTCLAAPQAPGCRGIPRGRS